MDLYIFIQKCILNYQKKFSKIIYQSKQDYFSEDISFQIQGNKINVISSNPHKSIKEIRKIIELRKDEYKNEEKNKIF